MIIKAKSRAEYENMRDYVGRFGWSKCQNCGQDFEFKKALNRSPKYCSGKCAGEVARRNSVAEQRKYRNAQHAGMAILKGSTVSNAVEKYKSTAHRALNAAEDIVSEMPGYDSKRHIELLRKPGFGKVSALRQHFIEILGA